jgi:phenylalanyl-tRNA synthetase beta chain
MLVSRDWLTDYVDLDMSTDELTDRLAMSGLNHEGTEMVGDDPSIDLEVTSNRGDWLGHIGVAREISVLWQQKLRIPNAEPAETTESVSDRVRVTIDCPDLCPRYTARLVCGVKVGPSPSWMVRRLKAAGIESVNNIVDATNYVMLESGQPLHAFDYAKLEGGQIVVRYARRGETLEAIDHRSYLLNESMCVIADEKNVVAIAGVMGGAETEIATGTTDVLIEVAEFQQLAVRNTARHLKLHSPSSYRFERGVDSHNVDWASRRCADLIMQVAGGKLQAGVVDKGHPPQPLPHVELRYSQIDRLIGITIPREEVERILVGLGCDVVASKDTSLTILAPSWRRDLTREVDLIEEVTRVYGYDKIPEDAAVPMSSSAKRDEDRVLAVVRNVLTASGFFEVITASAVVERWSNVVSPWSDEEPIQIGTAMLKGSHCLRRTLIPSLMGIRSFNERQGNRAVSLFETAHVYLPRGSELPREQRNVGMLCDASFEQLKGVVESISSLLHLRTNLRTESYQNTFFEPDRSAALYLGEQLLGFLGIVDAKSAKVLGVRSAIAIAELDLDVLQSHCTLIPQHVAHSTQPAITQDVNMIVDESVTWASVREAASSVAGDTLDGIEYRETYRNVEQDGDGKKRILFTMTMRAAARTLTMEEANAVTDRSVANIESSLGGKRVQ